MYGSKPMLTQMVLVQWVTKQKDISVEKEVYRELGITEMEGSYDRVKGKTNQNKDYTHIKWSKNRFNALPRKKLKQ